MSSRDSSVLRRSSRALREWRAALFLALCVFVAATVMALTTGPIKTPSVSPAPVPSPTFAITPGAASSPSPSPDPTLSPTPAPSPTPSPTPTPTPSASPTPAPTPLPSLGSGTVVSEIRVGAGSEPALAVSPFDPDLIAVASQRIDWGTMCDEPQISISRDAGGSFAIVRSPWRDRCVDIHAVIAWGPGAGPGTSRLWAADAIPWAGGLALSTAYTDDLGGTWSQLGVETFTPSWVGCFPIIAVDNNPGSPNFGMLFAAYNWPSRGGGSAISVIATRDGAGWIHANVPPIGLAGYPYSWLFGPRLAFDGRGGVFLSFYEEELHQWSESEMFHEDWPGNIGRAGFVTTRISVSNDPRPHLDVGDERWAIGVTPSDKAAINPEAQSSLVVDATGRMWLAVNDKSRTDGLVHFGVSADQGATWQWRTLAVAGQDSVKPSLAVGGTTVFVGWHGVDARGRVHAYFAVSHNTGISFELTQLASKATYLLPADFNDTGLRENAEFSDGRVYWAWGDNRSGVATYLSVIEP